MLLVLLAVCLLSGFPHDCAGQRYVIVAPHTVRPHSTYEVLVTNLAEQVQQFRCEIVDSQDVPVRTQLVRVDPQRIAQADINIGSLEEGKYQLKVWNEHLAQLLNSTSLMFSSKSYTVLFQTDKPEYKPGDKVQFRVLFLLPNLRPVLRDVAPSVFITDPSGYRIQKWIDANVQNGVFEGSFQLAPHTTIGDWSISALVNDQHFSDTFRVAEYILPVFKVELNSIPKSFHCDQQNMELRLAARYMGGGMVRGNATIVARANYNNYPSQTKEVGRRHLMLNGTVVVQFPTSNVTAGCDEERNVWFDVEVMDSLTGVSYNLTKKFKVYSILYNMDIIDDFEGFYPGLPINLKVRLSEADGSAMANEAVTIIYKVINSDQDMDDGIRNRELLNTNSHGIARLRINTTSETYSVHVEGYYKNITFPLLYAEPLYLEKGVKFLTAYVRRAYHTVNDNITINLDSNVSIRRIFYIGYCRGTVCTKGAIESENAKKHHTLVIPANSKMPPNMKLVMFSVLENGEILSYPVIVQFTSVGINAFKVRWTQDQPGMYKFNIRAENGAFVGLLGVDQSITLRPSSNNDITLRKIESTEKDSEDSMVLWSVHDSFGSLGATLLTDGYLTDVGNVYHGPGGGIADYSRNNLDDDTRQDFPETWIWESLTAIEFTLLKRIPDTITTWVVTGFAVGQEHGLVVLKEPVRINNAKEVYAQLHAPASIKQFEVVDAVCLIHNNGNNITVNVELSPNFGTKRNLFLRKEESKRIPFKLLAKAIGVLTVDVVVKTQKGVTIDTTRQSIAVHPAGEEKVADDVRYVNFEKLNSTNISMTVKQLNLTTSCSATEVQFSVIGTLVNLNQYDLESMVSASYGSGGESLLFLQTAISVYEYLNKVETLNQGRKQKLIGYIEVAYQQHLRFRLNDGSFSMFGTVRKCSSIWLTAATVETLVKARTYLAVDNSVIVEGLSWLTKQSQDDGSFKENCPIVYPHIQSTGGKELSLATSVLFAFVGNEYSERYSDLITKTDSLLRREPIEDVYVLAKMAYLMKNDRTILKKLNDKIVKQGSYYFWRVSNRSQPTPSENTRNQGATAYALLANLNQYKQTLSIEDLLRVAQWIQQNMFTSDLRKTSLEKIVALQALKSLQDRVTTVTPNMNVQYRLREQDLLCSN
ncbi:murinoglobulin-1-like [Anopheles ziemanni]|uniref:murinoglobulin-1-like n=1 Tax=Anopheles ziemanni TaxID=345580 RepID=UPI00265F8A51|nr:murinoglobulin-1-like [Anopheles ziemanni]